MTVPLKQDPWVASQDGRALVGALGIGEFNATMVIPYLFKTPATTDPDMPPVYLLVKGIQRGLRSMGATTVPEDGRMGAETAVELRKLTGPNWPGMTWYLLYETVIRAMATGRSLAPVAEPPTDMVSLGALPALPDVPGGMVTWALGAGALWWFFFHKRKAR